MHWYHQMNDEGTSCTPVSRLARALCEQDEFDEHVAAVFPVLGSHSPDRRYLTRAASCIRASAPARNLKSEWACFQKRG